MLFGLLGVADGRGREEVCMKAFAGLDKVSGIGWGCVTQLSEAAGAGGKWMHGQAALLTAPSQL